jgi:hypothetical protein
VLDLFAGYPSKRKLALWTDDASFHDPLTIAQGRKQYEAQWYGLKVTMSEIVQEHAEVVKGGNPIELKLKTMYKVKAVGKEQTIDSSILIHTTGAGTGEDEKITKVEDRWGGDVPPDGIFAKVSLSSPSRAVFHGGALAPSKDMIFSDSIFHTGNEESQQRHGSSIRLCSQVHRRRGGESSQIERSKGYLSWHMRQD